ncbi:MAG: TRAFs-binding domain-containing protein [Pyrinomonadaceae bacterium]
MPDEKKTCFVVMGFGEKVDLASGRKLNLDASYQNLIKPTVEEAGLECYRADEIVHSGNINVPMYERILTADLVIADLSTSNNNAFYELGVRHALRPYTTIIIAEDQFKFPFDIAQIAVRTYKHLGDDIGVSEAKRFREGLKRAIDEIMDNPTDDSPVYTFLHGLRRLELPGDLSAYPPPAKAAVARKRSAKKAAGKGAAAGTPDPAPVPAGETHSAQMQKMLEAKSKGEFVQAKNLLTDVRAAMKKHNAGAPEDPYIIQQHALVTYKSKQPTPEKALAAARNLLKTLQPETSNDTETLGLWGAVHKRLWELSGEAGHPDTAHLDEAVRGYERGFYLRNDYYNGINLAYLLNLRAANAASRAEAVADFVQAERVRREVLDICEGEMENEGLPAEQKYWMLATMAEAYVGIGDEVAAEKKLEEAVAVLPGPKTNRWEEESTREQMGKLRALLADSPLKYVKTDGD